MPPSTVLSGTLYRGFRDWRRKTTAGRTPVTFWGWLPSPMKSSWRPDYDDCVMRAARAQLQGPTQLGTNRSPGGHANRATPGYRHGLASSSAPIPVYSSRIRSFAAARIAWVRQGAFSAHLANALATVRATSSTRAVAPRRRASSGGSPRSASGVRNQPATVHPSTASSGKR